MDPAIALPSSSLARNQANVRCDAVEHGDSFAISDGLRVADCNADCNRWCHEDIDAQSVNEPGKLCLPGSQPLSNSLAVVKPDAHAGGDAVAYTDADSHHGPLADAYTFADSHTHAFADWFRDALTYLNRLPAAARLG